MMTDAELTRLLTRAAESFEPPAHGASRILERTERAARTMTETRRRRRVPPLRALQWSGATLGAMAVVALLVFAITTGRSSSGSKSAGASVAAGPSHAATGSPSVGKHAPALAPGAAVAGAADAAAGAPAGNAAPAPLPVNSARVVQTGQVSLQVPRGQVTPALDRLTSLAVGAGGYVAASRSDSASDAGSGSPSGTSTLRVPVARFTSVLTQVRRIGRVTSISSQAQDVTAQYVDLGARIDALQQTRDTFLTLLTKATTIGDTLSVQQQIQTVQTQIEQLQGQQKLLGDRSDLATLAVSVSEASAVVVPPAPKPHHPSGFAKAWHSAAHGFNTGLQSLITVAGPLLLALLVLGTFTMLGRQGYRLVRRWQA